MSGAASDLEGVAIIGMACLFPQASDLRAFWQNIVRCVDAIGEPEARWEAERYLASERITTSAGGYLKDSFHFDPRPFGIMPSSLDGGEPDQFLALRVARDALADAGYLERPYYDHEETGIILGHSTYLHRGQGTLIQNHIVLDQTLDVLRELCPYLDEDALGQVRTVLGKSLPASTTDIAPALVPNVMTGRIANRLNLKGPNYLVDAACSSSLLAVSAAMDELRAGRSRMMLAGGVNASLPAEVAVIFSQLGALSRRGKVRPFESGSDGTLLGEGLGVVVLKRLSDALQDDDRIYAVVRAVGQSSDGRGKGLLAPSEEGETLAIRRAYESSGIEPGTVTLIEAHGTGIPLGDATEIQALKNVFGTNDAPQGSIALGSVKSMISHCIPAAGMAGLIKTALAVHHRVLPPTLCDEVNPALGIEAPLYVNRCAAPWISPPSTPRRAGIDSFGFGGINTHAILDEPPREARRPALAMPWSAELCVFSAESHDALLRCLEAFAERLAERPDWTTAEIAAALADESPGDGARLAIVATSRDALAKSVDQALERLKSTGAARWSTRSGTSYVREPLGGRLAFLFPGEGSQYFGMLSELAMCFDEVREWLDLWCGLYEAPVGSRRTDFAFAPPSSLSPQRRTEVDARLHDMDVGSEAVFIAAQAMYAVWRKLGLRPDAMLGHSSGESAALAASEVIGQGRPAEIARTIRTLNAVYERILADGKIPTGALLAVGALDLGTLERCIAEVDPAIAIAMDNCKHQRIVYGSEASIASLLERLTREGGICVPLPFDRGYHTNAFDEARRAFLEFYESLELSPPKIPLYSCASVSTFPQERAALCELAAAQWSQCVRFQDTIEQMYEDGIRTFVEVGPSGNLTSFVSDILGKREHAALASNQRKRSSLAQFLQTVGQLWADGHSVDVGALFGGRCIETIDLESAEVRQVAGVRLDNTLPKVRLDEDARRQLRALVTQGQGRAFAASGRRDTSSGDLPASVSHARAEAPPLPAQPVTVPSRDQAPPYGAFLDHIVERDHEHLVARCQLSALDDNFLRDHVLSGPVSERDPNLLGLSCVPMMVSLELMAQGAAALAGTVALQAIENVVALDWIALDDGEVTLDIRAELVDAQQARYRASLESPAGTALRAEFLFAPSPVRCEALPRLGEYQAARWNGDALYTSGMFHGPIFQSVAHIDGVDGGGIEAQLGQLSLRDFFVDGHEPSLLLNPVLLDAMGQLAAYWIAQYAGPDFNCFPSTIERIELHAHCPRDLEGARLHARQRPLDPSRRDVAAPRSWDFECVDEQGQPLVRLKGLSNVFFPVPNRFYQVRRAPLDGWLGGPCEVAGREGLLLWELPLLEDDFCRQSNGIFLRILAHIYLASSERDAWRTLSGSLHRKREWLLGRACLKEAVRYWVYRRTGQMLYPSDIEVGHDSRGAPFVDGDWVGRLSPAPRVSLSHDRSACLAAVVDPACRVGIDREEIGRVQQPDLVAQVLTAEERRSLSGVSGMELQDRLLRIWCAKEATAKFLGTGLQGLPEAFSVQFVDPEFRSAYVQHAETPVWVDLLREGSSIIALASEQQWGDVNGAASRSAFE